MYLIIVPDTSVILKSAKTLAGAKVSRNANIKRLQKRIDEDGFSWLSTDLDRWQRSDIVSEEVYNKCLRRTKKVTNLMSGKEIEIDVNTPACCDPSTETYWSM